MRLLYSSLQSSGSTRNVTRIHRRWLIKILIITVVIVMTIIVVIAIINLHTIKEILLWLVNVLSLSWFSSRVEWSSLLTSLSPHTTTPLSLYHVLELLVTFLSIVLSLWLGPFTFYSTIQSICLEALTNCAENLISRNWLWFLANNGGSSSVTPPSPPPLQLPPNLKPFHTPSYLNDHW